MSFATGLVEEIKKMVYDPSLEGNAAAITSGLKKCTMGLRKITQALLDTPTVSSRMHLTTCMGHIKTFRQKFRDLQEVTGEGFNLRKETACNRVKWEDLHSAFLTRIRTAVIINLKHIEPKSFLEDCSILFRRRIQNALKKDTSLKVNAIFCGSFGVKKGDEMIEEMKYFNTRNAPIYQNTDLLQWFKTNIQDSILKDLDEFQERDSGWALSSIINLQVNINKYSPQLGSSYIELPEQIKKKHACINVKNDDNACFAWSIMAALHPVEKSPNRTSSYSHYSKVLNLEGIQFPMTMRQIPRFEKQNDISINVYLLSESKRGFDVLPTYLTADKRCRHVNLLLIQDRYYTEEDIYEDNFTPIKYHYVWIKSLSRLLSSQLNNNQHHKFFCDRCLHYFHSQKRLDGHIEDCTQLNDCVAPKVPTKDRNMIEFKNVSNKLKNPFILYVDTECLLLPIDDTSGKSTEQYQKHVPYSLGYYLKCSYDDTISYYRSYTGPDCMEWFTKELLQIAEDVETVFLCPYDMTPLSPQQEKEFQEATHCHICEKPFTSEDKKVRDHFHLIHPDNNNYRGPAHESCNINFQDSHTVPVVFHNMSSYDGHLIIKALAQMEGRIDILPINKEKYISFTKHIKDSSVRFRFIDSFRFMASSLDKLSSYLDSFPLLKSQYLDLNEEQYALLCRKGVFPYDYMDSWSRLEDTALPSKRHFHNQLEDVSISDDSYKHAQKVWSSFGCQTLQDYSDIYLKTDVLLLADVFEQFRESCWRTYGLDPAHSYTLPGYAWQCSLKHTQVELELLTDINMILFIERGIRGGLSQCSKRRATANNKYMPNYDATKETKYLMYYDVNNQYGWAMSQYLPTGNFKWVEKNQVENLNVCEIPDDNDVGYIMEVDIEVPENLHDYFSDLPPCPEHMCPPGSKNIKLMATLYDKHRYVIHYRNLKQAIELGCNVRKVHRILQFKQAPWLKKYIDLNTRLRAQAKNEFEKNLFKLMNNAVFGKTMENIRNHTNIKLISKWNGRYGAEALISNPFFKSVTILEENLIIIEMAKLKVYFNKPIYIGMSILDLAKTTIYEFQYNYMKRRLPDCNILYTDTDSLIYEIKNNDPYMIMREDCQHHFDTSDYSEDNIYCIPRVNKKVLGMMKDENNGRIMTHFVGLRSKMYAIKVQRTKEEEDSDLKKLHSQVKNKEEIRFKMANKGVTKKIKGIKKSVIKTKITFDDYIECLENLTEKSVTQNLIRSNKHELYSVRQTKVALSPHDDKRFIIKGCVNTLPLGHYTIMHVEAIQ